MPKREWDEIDEQMERESRAIVRSMTSVGRPKRNGVNRDNLKPGQARVPMKGTGGGEKPMSLGQICWATNYGS